MTFFKSPITRLVFPTLLLILTLVSPAASAADWNRLLKFGPQPMFDAAHSVAVKGTITAGQIVVATGTSNYSVEANVKSQLYYTVGQLNGLNGVADLNRVKVSVGERKVLTTTTELVSYAAELFIAWPRTLQIPASYRLVLPARGDYQGLQDFYDKFGADQDGAKACMADEAHEVSQGILWYYYRPLKRGCALRSETTRDQELSVSFNINLATSPENTQGKSPEYDMVWQDNRVVVTAIFGMNDYEHPSANDPGLGAVQDLYQALQREFGAPTATTLADDQELSLTNKSVEATFKFGNGTIEAHLFLVDGIRMVDANFVKRYNELTRISDFVSYSGHSGLGANIQAMARMGEFEKDQYQIFMINGCDTFAYVDNSLRDAHALANPGFGKDKYFDVITNAMPSYFMMNARSNMAVIRALANKAGTYREILAKFDISQRAVVTGEQDNQYPAPFNQPTTQPATQPSTQPTTQPGGTN